MLKIVSRNLTSLKVIHTVITVPVSVIFFSNIAIICPNSTKGARPLSNTASGAYVCVQFLFNYVGAALQSDFLRFFPYNLLNL